MIPMFYITYVVIKRRLINFRLGIPPVYVSCFRSFVEFSPFMFQNMRDMTLLNVLRVRIFLSPPWQFADFTRLGTAEATRITAWDTPLNSPPAFYSSALDRVNRSYTKVNEKTVFVRYSRNIYQITERDSWNRDFLPILSRDVFSPGNQGLSGYNLSRI